MSFKSKKMLLGATYAALALSTTTQSDWGNMRESITSMREEMNRMFDAFDHITPSSHQTALTLEENKEGILLRMPLEGAENFDSSLHENKRLVVNVPSHGIVIAVTSEGSYISVSTNKTQESHKKNGGSSSSYSSSQQSMRLAEPINLEQVDITYADNVLSIFLPKKTGKKIEVKIKK